jgi:DNA-binding CsgD family transcriptional regulator
MLVGRRAETEAIDRLLADARTGRSGVLVLRGEAGIGKSALLAYAAECAEGMTVLRGTGIESESELAFAGLHQLLRPVLDRLEQLPEPQAAALRAAFALSNETIDDRFRIALAVLGLLSEVAEDQPLLCLVDDAQWLDRSSTDALLFVARRLDVEGIVMLFGAREGEARSFEARELAQLVVQGLEAREAGELIGGMHGDVAPAVRDRLVTQAAGNALALVELPAALSARQLAGAEPLPETLPLTRDVERVFLDRVRRLPEPTQRLLLLVAADHAGSLAPIFRAAEAAGVDPDALIPAEEAGLVSVSSARVELRHPLVRSAIYQGSSSSERRAAHLGLANALEGDLESDQRAWHRSGATVGPDEGIAEELEHSAERARLRGGYAGAATALARSAELSTDPEAQGRRLVAAGGAAWNAGQPERATWLLDQATPLVSDARLRAELDHVRGVIELRCGALLHSAETLVTGAAKAARFDSRKAFEMLFDASEAAAWAGDHARMIEVGRGAAALPKSEDTEDVFLANLLVGVSALMEGRPVGDVPFLFDVIARADDFDEPRWLVWAAVGASAVGDEAREAALLRRADAMARASGAVDTLALVLQVTTGLGLLEGRHSVAAEASEGLRLAREAGLTNVVSLHLAVLAWFAAAKGDDGACRAYAAEVSGLAPRTGAGFANAIAEWGLALLDLSGGRADEAVTRLDGVRAAPPGLGHPQIVVLSTADLVEACVRTGREADARTAYALLEVVAAPGAPAWTLALAARCRALLAEDGSAEREFAEALRLHSEWDRPFDRARTELLFGEHLRRQRRRMDSREHLRSALETFEALDALPWAERARSELRASGETARKRDPSTIGQLTPQELQIARLVGEGASNKEVAIQLFLSPRTVEYHLRKVFMKLGIASRSELIREGFGAAVAEAP